MTSSFGSMDEPPGVGAAGGSSRERAPPSSSSNHGHSYSMSHSFSAGYHPQGQAHHRHHHASHPSITSNPVTGLGLTGGPSSTSLNHSAGHASGTTVYATSSQGHTLATSATALGMGSLSLDSSSGTSATTLIQGGNAASGSASMADAMGLGFSLSATGSQAGGAATPTALAATQTLVSSVVQRLVNRLPCNSGWRLSSLEEEELVKSCVSNLISLANYQLGVVLRELLTALEGLHRVQDEKVGIDVMQSQFFLLQLLAACMVHHWRLHADGASGGNATAAVAAAAETSRTSSRRGSATTNQDASAGAASEMPAAWPDPPPLDDGLAKQALSVMTTYLRYAVQREDALMALDVTIGRSGGREGDSAGMGGRLGKGRAFGGGGGATSKSSAWPEETVTSATGGFEEWGMGGLDRPGTASAANGQGGSERSEGATLAALALTNGSGLFSLYPTFPPACAPVADARAASSASASSSAFTLAAEDGSTRTGSLLGGGAPEKGQALDTMPGLMRGIYRQVSMIVFYLSSSNWPVVYARIRNRLGYLSNTAEENPSSAELRLLECSNLPRPRLASLLQELCTAFIHLKRSAQLTVALVLRRCIWSWIQYHPAEVSHLFSVGRRMEGGAEALFDHAAGLAESTRRKAAIWPMLTSLLILCPDIVSKAAIGSAGAGGGADVRKGGAVAKKVAFLEQLRRGLRNSKLSDISALCCVDICRAAAMTSRGETGLRLLVPDIEADLKERLFDAPAGAQGGPASSASPTMGGAYTRFEVSLTVDALVAFFRLDPAKTVSKLLPTCMGEGAAPSLGLALICACMQLASEGSRIPWFSDVSLLYPKVGPYLRQRWKELLYKLYCAENVPAGGRTDLKRNGSVQASTSHDAALRLEVLHSIMELWCIDIASLLPGLDYTLPTSLRVLAGVGASDGSGSSGNSTKGNGTASLPSRAILDQDRLVREAMRVDSVLSLIYLLERAALLPASCQVHDKALQMLAVCRGSAGLEGGYGLASTRPRRAPHQQDQQRQQASDFFRAAEEALVSTCFDFVARAADRLTATDSPSTQRTWLLLLTKLVREEAALLRRAEDRERAGPSNGAGAPTRVDAAERATPAALVTRAEFEAESDAAETALLLAVCSADTNVCSLAMRACGHYAWVRRRTSSYTDDDGDPPAVEERLRLFEDLADPGFVLTGRIAQQKRVRSLLRGVKAPWHAALVAWKVAYRRWSSLTQVVAKPLADDSRDAAPEKAAAWHNYAGFLTSLGGACMIDDAARVRAPALQLSGVGTGVGGGDGAAGLSSGDGDGEPLALVEAFMQEMVDLLVCESRWAQEKVRDSLGLDLSARLNGILLRQTHAVLSDFFDKLTGLPRPAAMFTTFVQNSISVVLMVLNRMEEATEATLSVDIGSLMVLYVEYVNSLVRRDAAVLRIRTAMCQLCDALMRKKAHFAFTNELRVRNRLFQALVTWTSSEPPQQIVGSGAGGGANTAASGGVAAGGATGGVGTMDDPPRGGTPVDDDFERAQRELDTHCLRTVSVLLDRLPLLLADDALLLDDKVEWAKSRQFSLYSSYFIKVLNQTRALEQAAEWRARNAATLGQITAKHGAGGTSAQSSASAQIQAQARLRELAPIRESAILALSNLLASNIDSGLQHSLQLAYDEDPQLRAAFMRIMTNVLNQGAAFDDLERLSASQGPQSKLVDLLCEPDLQLALAVCNVCRGYDQDVLDATLLSIFDSRGGTIRFLKAALAEEIERTASEEMVFRSNSFRTHLLSIYGRTHGYEYLRSIMAPLITDMANKPRGYSFEIDPSRLEPGDNAVVNQHRLEEMAQAFIDQICSSAHRVPAVLRELCRHIRALMDRRFPHSRYQGVGGFMFLRFLGPAVVAPQIIDIHLTGPGRELRRGLLLISKILQTLASNNLFSPHKEPFMTSLNDFLKRNVWRITTFLDQVSDARTDPERLQAADQALGYGIQPMGYGIDPDEQHTLHRVLFENVDKIGKELLMRAGPAAAGEAGQHGQTGSSLPSSDPRRVYENLCAVLAEMGDVKHDDAPTVSLAAHGTLNGKQTFQEFLRRNSGRAVDEESYRRILREGPPSKAGRPVLYYNSMHLDAQTVDYEGLILYMLQVLEGCLAREFDVVFDCTLVHPSNLSPVQWVTYFTSMVPPEVSANLRNVIVFNANTVCRNYVKPWRRAMAAGMGPGAMGAQAAQRPAMPSLSRVHTAYCNSLPELEAFIERRNIALDATTVQIATSVPERRFTQVTMVWYYRALVPVQFRIGGDFLQVTALKPQDILPGLQAFTNDTFHLADVDDVRAISIRGDDNTFFLTCRGGTVSFLFISRERGEIVQALRQAKARVQRLLPTRLDRTLRPGDVPGTLLNMALLNALSADHALRVGAYELLCALSTSFNFGASSAGRRLLAAKGLALPANMGQFVHDLSRDFAVAAPGVTLEFLTSFFEGFERAGASQRTTALYYLAPWLANLAIFTHTSRERSGEYSKRVKEVLSKLISITVKQPDMYAAMQRAVWAHVSRLDDLIPLLVEVFAEAAMDSGLHTSAFDAVLDTMVSFSSVNLRGKLLARLRRVVAKTAQTPGVAQLHDNAAWKEIVTLVRMNLALSFSSGVEAALYLPELLHVVLLLAGNGSDAVRRALHGTAVNLVHSLTAAPAATRPGATDELRGLLARLSDDSSLELFGLPPGGASASPDVVRDSPSNAAIERLAFLLYQVVDLAAPSTDAANAWRARLTSLVTSTAFQYNPIIQARAFVLLGCLAKLTGSMMSGAKGGGAHGSSRHSEAALAFEVDDDLLYQILVSLRGSITEWATAGNDAPIVAIVTCLSDVVRILPDRSRYLPQMFWLGVCMVQYGHVPLFKAAVDLLHSTVHSIHERRLSEEHGSHDLVQFLLDGRYEFRDAACRLDDEAGVDFDVSFSFAMAALLVKGLRHPTTRQPTADLLHALLRMAGMDDASGQRIPTDRLGFLVALLPTAAARHEDLSTLLREAGCAPDVAEHAARDRDLFRHLEPPEHKIALLVVTLLTSLLQHAQSDAERLLLYACLADAAREVPAIVSILYTSLAPGMRDVVVNSQMGPVLDAVHTIAHIAASEPVFAAQAHETSLRGGAHAYLDETGYASLLDCGDFTPLHDARRLTLAKLSTTLLAGLIEAGTA